MTIGFDASRAFAEGRTGTENYSYQLLRALAKVDIENQYLIYLRPNTVIPSNEGIQLEKKGRSFRASRSNRLLDSRLRGDDQFVWPKNFKFKAIRTPFTRSEEDNTARFGNLAFRILRNVNFPEFWTQIGLALQTFIDPLDILFVPSHTLPLLRKPGLKTVITVHDLGAEYLPGLHQLKQVLYLKLMTHYQLKTASRIIAVSEATKKDLVKKVGVPSEKIKVIYEGVERNIFKKISKEIVNDIVRKYDLDREKYFLFVGTIQPRKNLEKLITAFSKFLAQVNIADERLVSGIKYHVSSEKKHNTKYIIHNTNFKLVLVGQKGWKSESIYNLPEKLGIKDKVRFLGRISDQDLVGLYNGATALVYPSLFEGFGLPIIEAFACGCPVITSGVSSMPEVAGKAALLVDPEKEEEIAGGMFKIIKNDPLREDLIQKGYNRVKEFDWEKTASETVKIFKEAK